MKIGFDPAKRARNLAKHGLDLADARDVLEGPCIDLLDDVIAYGEERWASTVKLGDLIVSGRIEARTR